MVGKGSDVVGDGVGFGVDAGVFFVVWVGAGAKLGVEVEDKVCDGVVGVVGSGVDVGIGASEMSRLTLATSTSCVPKPLAVPIFAHARHQTNRMRFVSKLLLRHINHRYTVCCERY